MCDIIIRLSMSLNGIDVNPKISGCASEGIQSMFSCLIKLARGYLARSIITNLEISIPCKKKIKKKIIGSNENLTIKLSWILQVWILLQAKNGFHSNTTKLVNIFRSLAISSWKKQKLYGPMIKCRIYSHCETLRRRITCRQDPTIKSGLMKL